MFFIALLISARIPCVRQGKDERNGRRSRDAMSTPASAGAAPAFAGVTSFLRKQELAPRRRGYSVRSSTGGSTHSTCSHSSVSCQDFRSTTCVCVSISGVRSKFCRLTFLAARSHSFNSPGAKPCPPAELAPRRRGYGAGRRAAKKAASRTAGGLVRPAFERTTFIQENTLSQHSFVFRRETGQESSC